MSITNRIKDLSDSKNITFAELERAIGLSNGQIRRWDIVSPRSESLQKVADYFNVSTDYLLGRTDTPNYYDLSVKDEKNIQRDLMKLIDDLAHADAIAFSKGEEPMDEETKELLIASLENSLRIGRIMAKKKFTPKKHRGNTE